MSNSNINQKFLKFHELRIKRLEMEKDCTDPDEWYKLSQEFAEIGSIHNQEQCQKRAEHYANKIS